jgi:beta-1,3-galactosyltransferase 1
MSLIQHENATYGDLIMLSHLEESAHVANTVKSIEFLSYLATCGSSWRYVSKLDDDSFLHVLSFYREFLHPQLDSQYTNRTMIGRHMKHWNPDFEYPGGQFYTLSWELVLVLARLYSMNPITDEHEDVLNGILLHEAGEWFEFIALDNSKAFDYDEGNEDVWAWSHRVVKGAINPHKLKDDDTYLKVAAMYDGNGVRAD